MLYYETVNLWTDAIANVSGGSTVKYFEQATNISGQVTFSDSVYPNPIAAMAPNFTTRDTLRFFISRYYFSSTDHYWIASASSGVFEGVIVRVFYI